MKFTPRMRLHGKKTSESQIIQEISQMIHGMVDSKSSLLDKLPDGVENIEDIDRVKKEFEEKLVKEKSGFLEE